MEKVTKYRANPDLVLREIAGENLLIPVGEISLRVHGLISLSESGLLLWNTLAEPREKSELVAALLAEYEVDAATAEQDVTEFLSQMARVGILETEETAE